MKLLKPLQAQNSQHQVLEIEQGQELHDIKLLDYVTYSFRWNGKTHTAFRRDLVVATHTAFDAKLFHSSIGLPGMTILYEKNGRISKDGIVLRHENNNLLILNTQSGKIGTITIDDPNYLCYKQDIIDLPAKYNHKVKSDMPFKSYHSTLVVRQMNRKTLNRIKMELSQYDAVALDLETRGLSQLMFKFAEDKKEDFLICMSLSFDSNHGYYIYNDKSPEFRELIQWVLTNKRIICHNSTFDLGVLKYLYNAEARLFEDTLFISKLLNENLNSYSLKELGPAITGRGKQLKLRDFDFLAYINSGRKQEETLEHIEDILAYYAAADTANTYALFEYSYNKLIQDDTLYNYYRNIEIASVYPVAIAINHNGLKVDIEKLANLRLDVLQYRETLMSSMLSITQKYTDAINKEYYDEQVKAKLDYYSQVRDYLLSNGLLDSSTKLIEEQIQSLIMKLNFKRLPAYTSIKKVGTYLARVCRMLEPDKEGNVVSAFTEYDFDLGHKEYLNRLVFLSPSGFRLPEIKTASGNLSLGKPALIEINKIVNAISNDEYHEVLDIPEGRSIGDTWEVVDDWGTRFTVHLSADSVKSLGYQLDIPNATYILQMEQILHIKERLEDIKQFFSDYKEYIATSKLLDAFIIPTLETITGFVDGKLHPNYNLMGTVSSRASCSNPNLQQLANNKKFDLRRCFVVDNPEEQVFLQFDYQAQELRVMAALSGDPTVRYILDSGIDAHSETVRRVWSDLAELSDEEIKKHHKDKRDLAKTILYALAYGAGPRKIALSANVTFEYAKEILKLFKEQAYPVLIKWLEETGKKVAKDGKLDIIGGYRRRFVPTGDKGLDAAIIRSIVNSAIQGLSAYITKQATLRVLEALKEAGIEHRLIIIIHDSITLQVSKKDAEKAYKIVEDAMAFHLNGILIPGEGAINQDMSKNTELNLEKFMEEFGEEDY